MTARRKFCIVHEIVSSGRTKLALDPPIFKFSKTFSMHIFNKISDLFNTTIWGGRQGSGRQGEKSGESVRFIKCNQVGPNEINSRSMKYRNSNLRKIRNNCSPPYPSPPDEIPRIQTWVKWIWFHLPSWVAVTSMGKNLSNSSPLEHRSSKLIAKW